MSGEPTGLPHRGNARLLRKVLDVAAAEISGTGLVPPDSPYVTDGEVPSYVALELAAQLAAALALSSEPSNGTAPPPPRVGYVVRVRSLEALRSRLPAGVPWHATVRYTGGAGDLTTYEGAVRVDDQEVLRCSFSTLVPSS